MGFYKIKKHVGINKGHNGMWIMDPKCMHPTTK